MVENLGKIMVLTIIPGLGLVVANRLLDKGVPHFITRKIGHLCAGIAYFLSPFLFATAHIPVAISAAFAILLTAARRLRPSSFRGVGGSARMETLAEVYFPILGTISLTIGWLILGNPWLGVIPILFLCWGDLAAGLVNAWVYKERAIEHKGLAGSISMLVVCLLISLLYHIYWVAVIGSMAAVLAEKYTKARRYIDDNPTIVVSSLTVMTVLTML